MRLAYPAGCDMALEVTPDRLRCAPAEADDPEVERVKAVLESRLLGGAQVSTRIGRFVVLERIGAPRFQARQRDVE